MRLATLSAINTQAWTEASNSQARKHRFGGKQQGSKMAKPGAHEQYWGGPEQSLGKCRVIRLFLRGALLQIIAAAMLVANAPAGQNPGAAKSSEEAKPKTAYQKFLEKGRLRDFPERDWEQAFARDSQCYRVRTNTSPETAEYVGVLMDAVHYHYCRLFGVRGTRKASINVFRTHKEMASWGKKHCKYSVSPKTIGFYTTGSGGTICVVWKRLMGQHPQTVLMHEGTHQFVGAVWGSRTLPIWLNEGFAVYFENSHFDGRNLDAGRIPVARLTRLQKQMMAGKHVTLEKLFALKQKGFKVEAYGSAWAFVYWLAHSGDERARGVHQAALSRFVTDCRSGKRNGKQLAAYLGLSMADLEKQWKEWTLKLDPKDIYGGVRKDRKTKAEQKSGK